jgi:hypothetical protein
MVAMRCHGIVIMPDDKCEDEEFGIAAKSTKIAKRTKKNLTQRRKGAKVKTKLVGPGSGKVPGFRF